MRHEVLEMVMEGLLGLFWKEYGIESIDGFSSCLSWSRAITLSLFIPWMDTESSLRGNEGEGRQDGFISLSIPWMDREAHPHERRERSSSSLSVTMTADQAIREELPSSIRWMPRMDGREGDEYGSTSTHGIRERESDGGKKAKQLGECYRRKENRYGELKERGEGNE